MIRLCLLTLSLSALFVSQSMIMAADDSQLEKELAALGIGVNDEAPENTEGAGGAQGYIPVTRSAAYSSWDDDDDDEPDYLAMRNQKDFYPKRGDAMRLTEKNFDEEVFNGEQEFTLINFYSKWCKQCGFQAPSFRAAAKRYKNDPKVKIAVVNQEGNYDLTVRFDTEPSEPTIFFAHKNPQIDGDLQIYEGEVSFAALLQFIGSRGKEMIKVEKYIRPLYPEGETAVDTSLNWDNFNDTVFNKSKNVLVQFYAGWSEFCQMDAANYTVLAARMGMSNPDDVVIAAIDTDKHEQLADRFDVQGLPAYWFANKTAEKDTDLVKYTGDHNGAMCFEEMEPFINSQGMKVPEGMQHDWPIHPKPWEEIEKDIKERQAKEDEKDAQERKEQEERAVERREKLAKKKKVLEEKKAAKAAKAAKKKDEL